MNNLNRFLCLSVFLIFLQACTNNDAQQRFEAEAYAPSSEITEVDNQQNVISEDPDDWRISPIYAGLVQIQPLFPNPVLYNSVAYLEVTLNGAPISTFMQLGYLDFNNQWTPIQELDVTSDFEVKTFIIDSRVFGNSAELARGMHRLLLFDGNQRMITYGDIRIQ